MPKSTVSERENKEGVIHYTAMRFFDAEATCVESINNALVTLGRADQSKIEGDEGSPGEVYER
jgi:hypothetical protein